ncbi:MAG: SDR family NAD(P)-dependent oxidoreductase, partial [Miltoncostaeaceae bacterium]
MASFEDKVALVTGASSGIGRATAVAFGTAGARVALTDVQVGLGEECAQELRERGVDAHFFPADMAAPDEVEEMVGAVVRHWGRLDVAFNNAGIEGETAPVAECTATNWDRVLAVNLTGVFHCMRHE